ncbi:MAG: GC-type dockerin domain-anchored protein [Phycisphaerales bacterium]
MMNVLRLCVLSVLAVLGVSGVRAQCTPQWQPFDPTTATFPGVNGIVNATTMWDPDGPGPQTPKLVVGGVFTFAVNVLANNIALYDPATGAWSALGSGMSNGASSAFVYALTTLPGGDLIAGGRFTTAGGVTVNSIARWNGSAWSALGTGMNNIVWSLTTLPSGDLIAGGTFTTAGGVPANYIALWNGSAWSALGSGMSGGSFPTVFALTTLPSGDLIAGGDFTTAGGVPVNRIARWNGSAWSALGTGMNNEVTALTTLPNGDLIASGLFTNAGGVPANRIARWNGSAWSSLGSGLNGTARALTTLPSGDLIAGGGFTTAVGIVAPYLARWGCQPPAACNPADLANTDGEPGADGAVDNGDFNAFFIAFFATEGDPLRAAADISSTDGDTVLTGGGPDGTVDNGDFNAFFLYFFQGCP